MKANIMFRETANVWISIGLPLSVVLFVVFGLQSASLVAQLLFSCAAVAFFFSILIYLPYFYERHAAMRAVYSRYDALQVVARIREQRTQHYTLNRALSRHQSRGRSQLAAVRG
jgi:hypothetical protein